MSVKIDDLALKQLMSLLSEKGLDSKTLRIIVAGMGWGGPQFNLALDEQKENDFVQVVDELTFLVDKNLLDEFKGFSIDSFNQGGNTGLYVQPIAKPESGCTSCSGCN